MKKTYTAEKLGFMRDDGISYISFLAKDMPVSGLPHFIFGILMPGNKFVEDFFNYIPAEGDFRPGLGVVFGEPDGKNHYGHEHTLKEGGIYDAKLNFVPTKCTTKFNVEINGVKSVSYDNSSHDSDSQIKMLEFSAEMKKGRNSIKFVPEANGCLILSDMILQKR